MTKKVTKRAVALVLALVMVAAMSINAFAATTGAYAVTLYSASGTEAPHNPMTSADVVYNGEETVTLTIYVEKLSISTSYGTVTGYLTALSVEGYTMTAQMENDNDYPTSFVVTMAASDFEMNKQLEITYSLSYASHVENSGYIIIS